MKNTKNTKNTKRKFMRQKSKNHRMNHSKKHTNKNKSLKGGWPFSKKDDPKKQQITDLETKITQLDAELTKKNGEIEQNKAIVTEYNKYKSIIEAINKICKTSPSKPSE
jgi:hypothetical protein